MPTVGPDQEGVPSLVLLGAALREVPVIKNSRLIWVCREMADVILRAPLMGSMALVVRKALNVCLKCAKQLIRKLLVLQYTAHNVKGSLHRPGGI